MLRTANLALAFLLELCAVAAVGVWGFVTQPTWPGKLFWGLGGPILIIVVWGAFLAPRSSRRLPDPFRLLLEIVIFGLAALSLLAAGYATLGQIFFGLVFINIILGFVFGQRQTH